MHNRKKIYTYLQKLKLLTLHDEADHRPQMGEKKTTKSQNSCHKKKTMLNPKNIILHLFSHLPSK